MFSFRIILYSFDFCFVHPEIHILVHYQNMRLTRITAWPRFIQNFTSITTLNNEISDMASNSQITVSKNLLLAIKKIIEKSTSNNRLPYRIASLPFQHSALTILITDGYTNTVIYNFKNLSSFSLFFLKNLY